MNRCGAQLLILLCGACFSLEGAEQFGDISAGASAIYTGNTGHGYAETRVLLENHSHEKSHVVTLVYPNQSYNAYGAGIGRISRSVTLGPDAREVVTLLQPPLPTQGDGQIRVEVDRRHGGEIRAPNANNHGSGPWRGVTDEAVVLVSRNLDFDSVSHLFDAAASAKRPFSAVMAAGPPDAAAGSLLQNCWKPDYRGGSRSEWLELDYAKPQTVSNVVVEFGRLPMGRGMSGPSGSRGVTIDLIGKSGTNLATLNVATPSAPGRGSPAAHRLTLNYSCPATSEPVKSVRLNILPGTSGDVCIDAVEIAGPTGRQWASDARASSEAPVPAAPGRDQIACLRAESPVTEWSDNWLAYTPFDGIVLGAADLASMPPPVQIALGDYLSTGGFMVVAGTAELPARWNPLRKNDIDDVEYRVGFGRCLALVAADISKWTPATGKSVRELTRNCDQYWKSLPSEGSGVNGVLPVVANLEIPARGIVILMLGFVLAIGPVNIIVLNRLKRRTWMLWTIPAISAVTTLIVFAYSLLREGITPNARISGITLIEQATHHAATIGGTAFYCPLTPSDGLRFEYNSEVTPLIGNGTRGGSAREVDWSQSQQLRRGWLASRVPAYFHLRKPETRRERIQLLDEDGKLKIVNGLGAPIRSLWLATTNMSVYQSGMVAAGAKGGLTNVQKSLNLQKSGPGGLWGKIGFGAHVDAGPGTNFEGAAEFLLPNTYIAVLEGNPFMENALGPAADAKRTQSSSVVFGYLEPPDVK